MQFIRIFFKKIIYCIKYIFVGTFISVSSFRKFFMGLE